MAIWPALADLLPGVKKMTGTLSAHAFTGDRMLKNTGAATATFMFQQSGIRIKFPMNMFPSGAHLKKSCFKFEFPANYLNSVDLTANLCGGDCDPFGVEVKDRFPLIVAVWDEFK